MPEETLPERQEHERAGAHSSRPDDLAPEFGLAAQGYRLTETQAQAILDLRLQKLTGLEKDKILSEYEELLLSIRDLLDILARPERLMQVIQRCAEGTDYAALRARHITAPGLRALDAWAEGRYAEAADVMAALRPILPKVHGPRSRRCRRERSPSIQRSSGRIQASSNTVWGHP